MNNKKLKKEFKKEIMKRVQQSVYDVMIENRKFNNSQFNEYLINYPGLIIDTNRWNCKYVKKYSINNNDIKKYDEIEFHIFEKEDIVKTVRTNTCDKTKAIREVVKFIVNYKGEK